MAVAGAGAMLVSFGDRGEILGTEPLQAAKLSVHTFTPPMKARMIVAAVDFAVLLRRRDITRGSVRAVRSECHCGASRRGFFCPSGIHHNKWPALRLPLERRGLEN